MRRRASRKLPVRPCAVASAAAMLERLEGRVLLATHVWTGAVSDRWSDGGNWINGSPAGDPQAVLSFPSVAANRANTNDLVGLTVAAIDFAGGDYAVGGNVVKLVQGPSGAPRVHMDALGKGNTFGLGLERAADAKLGLTFDVAEGSTLAWNGVIGGGAADTTVVKEGLGKLVLGGANTFADGVLINAGALNIRDGTALGATPAAETGRTTINGGTLEVEGSLFVTETLVQGAAGGSLRNVSGNSTWAGGVVLAVNDLNAVVDPFTSLTIAGTISDDAAGPAFGLGVSGGGRLALPAANTYRGVTTVDRATLGITNAAALGTADGGTVVKLGGRLEIRGFITVAAEPLTLDGGVLLNPAGNNAWLGTVTLASSSTFDVASGTLTVGGAVGGASGFSLFTDAPGKMILTAANTFAGQVSVLGTLNVRNALALGQPGGPGVSVADGGALELELTGVNTISEGLSLVGAGVGGTGALRNVSGTNTWAGAVLLNFSSSTIGVGGGGQLTIGGVISQPFFGAHKFGITKVGEGPLFLTADNTFFGSTTINAGSVFANGSLAGGVALNGGRLGGTGTVGSIFGTGVINPGVGVGRLTTDGFTPGGVGQTVGVNFGPGTTFEVDLNGTTAAATYDQLRVSVMPDIDQSTLVVRLNFVPALGASFRIIDNANAFGTRVIGTFAGLPQGATIQTARGTLRISYVGGDGNDVVLTVVSAPLIFNPVNTPSRFPDRAVSPVIDEGGVATVTGTISDPDRNDVFFLDVDWGDGTRVEHRVFPPGSDGKRVALDHRYADDGVYTIRLAWRDKAGDGSSAELTTTVRNVAPVVGSIGDVRLPRNGKLHEFVTFDDPGRDVWTAVVNYGDGSALETIDVRGGGKFLLKHRYAEAGTYTVTVTVQDEDGGVGTRSFVVR